MSAVPERPISADWLALREPADARARQAAAPRLLSPLLERLRSPSGGRPRRAPRVLDLGSGTGANLRWLAPRLPDPDAQHWILVDHDPGLLSRGPVQAEQVRADVADLAQVLAGLAPSGGVDLVTAAALLDLLDLRELTAIVDAVVGARVPALFSLSVTGDAALTPADPRDGPLAAAFDAHQRRDARPGPDAGAVVAALFADRGWPVLQVATPWELDAAHQPELIGAWLEGRVEAAVEHDAGLATDAAGWRSDRGAALAAGALRVRVGHVDLLALPG